MESKTQFDLNHNLELWRQSLAQSPSFQSDNLDELEVHLRDSVSTLEAKGLSTEEAFLIAVRRVGQPTDLDTEFGKVNSETVWLSRWLWMAVGIFLFLCASALKGLSNYGLMEYGKRFDANPHVLGFLSIVTTVVLFATIILFLRRLAASNLKLHGHFINRNVLNRPVAFTTGLVVLGVSLVALPMLGNIIVAKGLPPSKYADYSGIMIVVTNWSTIPVLAAELLLLPMAIVYLHRRQLKARSTQA